MIETITSVGYWIAFAGFFTCVAGYFIFPKLIKNTLYAKNGDADENS